MIPQFGTAGFIMLTETIQSARSFEEDGDFVAALRLYREAYTRDSADLDAILGVAQCAMTLDNPELALEFYVKLLILDHSNPWGFLGRAQVMLRYRQFARALSDIARAIELDEPASDFRIDCAAALNDCGEPQKALEAIAPLGDDYDDDPDFAAEFLFASIVTGAIDSRVREMLENCEQTSDDPLFQLCRIAIERREHPDAAIQAEDIATILAAAPDLEFRATALGLLEIAP